MFDDGLRRITDEFRQQVLELLVACIDEAFDRALADLPRVKTSTSTAATASPPRKRRSKKAPKPQLVAVIEALPEPDPLEAAEPRRTRNKGASRDEIDRLVEEGLARRLAEDGAVTAPPPA